MLRPASILFLILFSLCACDKKEDNSFTCKVQQTYPCGTDSAKVNLRLVNVSSFDYCNVKVYGDGMNKNYGEILQGDTSCYITFDELYTPLHVSLIFEGDSASLEPGEYIPSQVANGFYTGNVQLTSIFLDSALQKRHGNIHTELIPD